MMCSVFLARGPSDATQKELGRFCFKW